MCCFGGRARALKYVGKSNLFARAAGERQLLVYSMNVAASEPVAMILPLPVPPGSPEDAVRFIDLHGYPQLFTDLDAGFPEVFLYPKSRGPLARSAAPRRTLEVHRVGDFEASFVPRVADFARLDPRFRMSDEVWRALPQYADWGFCVFKLIDLRSGWFGRSWFGRSWFGRSTARTIHPMAFEFPRRDASRLFFPTLHVHDGEVHPHADFDHTLYYQAGRELQPTLEAWTTQTSPTTAAEFVDVARSAGIVDGAAPVHRLLIKGTQPNTDVLLT
ncbi:MAG: hypothetical protein H0T76_15925 [Nannocystis sp.]|nr:hypothetical protein [Nannocystis sp.]MBA3547972.1 hypothetical protein [Nannocystis sp.]